jgi:hypothetical protein
MLIEQATGSFCASQPFENVTALLQVSKNPSSHLCQKRRVRRIVVGRIRLLHRLRSQEDLRPGSEEPAELLRHQVDRAERSQGFVGKNYGQRKEDLGPML